MKTALKIIIPAALVAIIALVIGYAVNEHYGITIGIAKPVSATNHYFEAFTVIYSYEPSKAKKEQANQMMNDASEFKLAFFEEHKEDSYHIELDIKAENGKTTVNYSGTITDAKTGAKDFYSKNFIYDFVLTDKIE